MTGYDSEDYESFRLSRTGPTDDSGADQDDDIPDAADDDPDADEPDDDDSDDDDPDEDDDEYEELDDAGEEDIDLIVGCYREDGEPIAQALRIEAANDLEELIVQLRRLPGDAGALALVSLAEEILIVVRVRGRNVQTLVSDGAAAHDWPLARDIADYLGEGELPDPDDDPQPLGDLGLLSDLGLSELDLSAICDDLDEPSDLQAQQVAQRINFGPQVSRVVEATFG